MNKKPQDLNHLLEQIDTNNFRQVDYAKLFIWYLTDIQGNNDCLMSDIVEYYKKASLSVPNQTRLRINLRRLKDVTVGDRYKSFRLHRNALLKYRTNYASLINQSESPEEVVRARLDVSNTPSLTPDDIEDAYKMGQVYVALHCLENSARNLIRSLLEDKFGEQWWDKAASEPMKRRLSERKTREVKNKWLASRGADELNYIDWGDLVTLIRKFPKEFEAFVGSTKFAELRLEELENLRNTIAHNGVLPDDEIARVELYFKDWCKQVS